MCLSGLCPAGGRYAVEIDYGFEGGNSETCDVLGARCYVQTCDVLGATCYVQTCDVLRAHATYGGSSPSLAAV
jgi:hypothetical protein